MARDLGRDRASSTASASDARGVERARLRGREGVEVDAARERLGVGGGIGSRARRREQGEAGQSSDRESAQHQVW